MLFNSIEFLVYFLPLSLIGYYLLSLICSGRCLLGYLSAISILFYAIGSPRSLPILTASVVLNYVCATLLSKYKGTLAGSLLLSAGLFANFGCLAWFKYIHFGLSNLNHVLGTHFEIASVFLPLGISFYTFKQIAYLMDVSRGEIEVGGAVEHTFTVIFFPQMIAGPIVLHRDLRGQWRSKRLGKAAASHLVVGLSIFAIGLFKRTVLADSATPFSDAVFDHASEVEQISFLSAWTAGLCYTLQLYFDFSGYSDMAVGVARMFGFKLPTNFYSPLKATSIIDYWRRWHITLQKIIGRYFFQPLLIPLSRFSAEWNLGRWAGFWAVTVVPTVLTFALLGLWHGAGWTFVLFGLLHGVYVAVNEAWRLVNRKRQKRKKVQPNTIAILGYHLLTLTAVVAANVLFRSDHVGDAVKIWRGMLRLGELYPIQVFYPMTLPELLESPLLILISGFTVIFLFPNTHQFFHKFASVIDRKSWDSAKGSILELRWRPTMIWATVHGFLFCIAIVFMLRVPTKFIYFNF